MSERKAAPMKTTKNSLFRKYLGMSLTSVLVSIVVLYILFLSFLVNYRIESQTTLLLNNSRIVSQEVSNLISSGKAETDDYTSSLLVGNMLNLISQSTDADIFLTDTKGNITLCKDLINSDMEVVNQAECSVHSGKRVPAKIVEKTTTDGYNTVTKENGLYDGRYIVTGIEVVANGQTQGYIFAMSPLRSVLYPFVEEISKLFVSAAIVALLIVSMLSYLFSYSLTEPLHEMTQLTKRYATGDFSKRIEVHGNDELEELADSLNKMAESLSILEDSRREFVANVSHELKTPMTTISGFIDGILDGTVPPKDEKHYLMIVSKEVKRLSHLVVTMLTLSKIEVGEEKLHYSMTDMNQLLFRALLSFETSIDEAGYKVEGFDTMPPVHAAVDEDMLFQVAYNLFDNAVKFTNTGGTIRIEMVEDRSRVTVSVSNTGEGIPPEQLGRIFERFYKLDRSRSEHVKGVGLGLNLARDIIHLHHGEISAESENGFTTFRFWVPKDPGNAIQE